MNKIKNNKKGLSEIISYVMLIVIAISLSIIVYTWLQIYVPKEKIECPSDVSLVINEYSCDENLNIINITFKNKGLFDVEGVNVKIANRSVNSVPIYDLKSRSGSIFGTGSATDTEGYTYFNAPMSPGFEYTDRFEYGEYEKILKIQITPFIFDKKSSDRKDSIVLCSDSAIVQEIQGCG